MPWWQHRSGRFSVGGAGLQGGSAQVTRPFRPGKMLPEGCFRLRHFSVLCSLPGCIAWSHAIPKGGLQVCTARVKCGVAATLREIGWSWTEPQPSDGLDNV